MVASLAVRANPDQADTGSEREPSGGSLLLGAWEDFRGHGFAALQGLLEQPRHSGFESVTKTNQRFAVAPSGAMACIADNQRHIHAYVYS